MKNKSYKINFTLNGDGGITSASCECPRGKWFCKHVAASAIYVNRRRYSKAGIPSAWISKPKKAAGNETKSWNFSPHSRLEYGAVLREITDSDRAIVFDSLG